MRYPTMKFSLTPVLLTALAPIAWAADHSAITPYITDDVLAVAFVDLDKIDLPAAVEKLASLHVLPEPFVAEARQNAAALQGRYDQLPQRGARRAYVLLRASDVASGGPTWVIETAKPDDAQAVAELLLQWREEFKKPTPAGTSSRAFRDWVWPNKIELLDGVVVAVSSDDQLRRLKERPSNAPREDALQTLRNLGDADAAAVVFGNADSRRVVREMFPPLPAPFMEIDGKLLAEGVKWGGVGVKFPPELSVTFFVEAAEPQVTATLQQAAEKGLALAKGAALAMVANPPPDLPLSPLEMVTALSLLEPRTEANRLSITLGGDNEQLAVLRALLAPAIGASREAAYRNSRMNQFKQIALGMLNHESARKAYPAAASYDRDGRPLLSWRVQILPYLEQMELYNQFHLDEPWDSEHNRKLVEQMPDVYADPDLAVRAAIGDGGRTTFVVPTGEGLMFGGREGMKIRDVIDGTSNTILAVEVVPDRAVVWTKPDDWEVDAKDVLRGVKRSDRDWFTTVWCDGHVMILSNSIDAGVFRALLTPAGGEVVDHADVK